MTSINTNVGALIALRNLSSTSFNLEAWYNTTTVYIGSARLMDLYAAGNPPVPGVKTLFTCPTSHTNLPAKPTVTSAFFMYGFNNRMDPNGAAVFNRCTTCASPVIMASSTGAMVRLTITPRPSTIRKGRL